jgi:putative transcriptional regulator
MKIPDEVNVPAIRKRLKMTQEEFAACFHFDVDALRHWEQGGACGYAQCEPTSS